jgi:hypothetical protein
MVVVFMMDVKNMSENMNGLTKKIEDLVVYAYGVFPVELSKGKAISQTKRVKLKASVDCETGEVSFYVDKGDIKTLEK